jgi:hypothetical protein
MRALSPGVDCRVKPGNDKGLKRMHQCTSLTQAAAREKLDAQRHRPDRRLPVVVGESGAIIDGASEQD